MSNKYYLYGASGHCKVLIDIIQLKGGSVAKVYDDNPLIDKILEIEVSDYKKDEIVGNLVISIGNNKIRKRISKTINMPMFK